jgi:hypothetical protein
MRGLDPEKSMLYYDCGAVHPWILKRSVLRTVGYYDSGYKVHEVEDNDFYHRIRVAGFHGLAIRVCLRVTPKLADPGCFLSVPTRILFVARSGVPHAAKCGRHSAVHFVFKTKMEMLPIFRRVLYLSTFLYGNGNVATVTVTPDRTVGEVV